MVSLAQGRFRGSDLMHRATGLATLYRCGDGSCLVRLTAFRVTNGPDLHVVLARHPDPANAGDIRRGYLTLGALRATQGDQEYTVPANVDPAAFASVAVYCRIFGVLFAPAPLRQSADISG